MTTAVLVKSVEHLPVVLTTIKVIGALLLVALAATFRASRVFSRPFRTYLVLQAFTVLSYSRASELVEAVRLDHPLGFALGTLPFLALFPVLHLSVRSATRQSAAGRDTVIIGITGAVTLIIMTAAIIPGGTALLPGPGAPAVTGLIWNLWHASWLAAAVVRLTGSRAEARRCSAIEYQILRFFVMLSALLLVISAALEHISYGLDFLITPLVIISVPYAAIVLLIIRAPRLIREGRERYAGSDLNEEDSRELAARAQQMLSQNDLWQNGGLTLTRLAGLCAASPRDLSQAVNQQFGVGFSAWVNARRLDEAEKLLETGDAKIAEIAFSVGFNSLSSFNSAFRKRRNMTPREWRRRMSNS